MGGSTNTVPAPAGRGPRGGRGLHDARHRPPLAQGTRAVQGRTQLALPYPGCQPRRRHPRDPGRTRPRRNSLDTSVRRDRRPHAGRGDRRPATCAARRWATTPRDAAGAAPPPASATGELGAQHSRYEDARHRPRGGLHPRHGARLFPRRRAGRADGQHRPAAAASSRPPASTKNCSLFRGPARVYESQEQAIERHSRRRGTAGRGSRHPLRRRPRAAPECRRCSTPPPTSNRNTSTRPARSMTDGRFSGGTSGLSIGHVSPEAASGGEIAVVRTGDPIEIDIPGRSIRLAGRRTRRSPRVRPHSETVSAPPHATAASRPRCAPTPCWSARPTRAPCASIDDTRQRIKPIWI